MQEQGRKKDVPAVKTKENNGRRDFLKTAAVAGATLAAGSAVGPFISNAEAAKTTVWKVQSTWDAGTSGYTLI